MNTSISPKGQATIPKPVRDFLGLNPGDKVEWEIHYENDTVPLKTPPTKEEKITPEQAVKELCGALKDTNILEEYLNEKHAEIEKEEREHQKFLKNKST